MRTSKTSRPQSRTENRARGGLPSKKSVKGRLPKNPEKAPTKNGPANGLNGNGLHKPAAPAPVATLQTGHQFRLETKLLLKIYDNMLRARLLEERLIKMYKQSDGYFWLGGPGEEAFNTALGMNIRWGHGLDHDFMHLHYRSNAILLAHGMDPMDPMRQMKNTATDPFSGGRNFCGHVSKREWNVVPITSTAGND